jgi:Uma2 family endonuclease
MASVDTVQELIEAPLSRDELAVRYRKLCDDPCYANVPGKLEIDPWGRLLMSPASNYHSAIQAALVGSLSVLGGRAFVESSILTQAGVLVPDVAWASEPFLQAHGFETPYTRAPELCIEVVSPSNSRKELREKIAAYLLAGASEVWLVFPKSRRVEFHGERGLEQASRFAVNLEGIFAAPSGQ